jgi:predicted RNase H-like HicB family nuclease
MKKSDRYLKIVEWSEEDGCYVGSCPGLFLGGCHGDNEEKVYHRLIALVGEWLEMFSQESKELPPATAGPGSRNNLVSCLLGRAVHNTLSTPLLNSHRP